MASTPTGSAGNAKGQARGSARVYDRPRFPRGFGFRILLLIILLVVALVVSYFAFHLLWGAPAH